MYLLFKVIHIVGFVAWFSGLFFLVRIFVYHTEAFKESEPAQSVLRNKFSTIELKVFKIICQPAMLITWIFGCAMVFHNGWDWFKLNYWLHFKLILVFMLSAYTDYCRVLIRKLVKGPSQFSSFQFRLWNELPSILLLSIALLAVYKNSLDFLKAGLGIILFALVIYIFAKVYRTKRLKEIKNENI